jgi:hypothetical protein
MGSDNLIPDREKAMKIKGTKNLVRRMERLIPATVIYERLDHWLLFSDDDPNWEARIEYSYLNSKWYVTETIYTQIGQGESK